ncbi:alpha/beta fold hydrolase [Reyranella sp.]|uniref:alpha/beta fold hydrolase n=1 Tax=Reyranella sp. TaxID=1929291 RepID=UPI003D0BA739
MSTTYRTRQVGDVEIFYREAGPADGPAVVLLHGFPTASHMFRDLMPILASGYRVIAPDLPGFGNTIAPPRSQFDYTFDTLAWIVDAFLEAMQLDRYVLYIFDYGAPIGLRIASKHPERVAAIVSQNGNAYLEGFGNSWSIWQAYWREPTAAHREACRASLSPDTIRNWQYFDGSDRARVSPDGYTLDIAYMARPGRIEIQLDLILDYRSNVALYPVFQAYLREHRPPLLAAWGRKDAHFVPAGALAFRTDVPDAEINFVDAGHFALETHATEIGALMLSFLGRILTQRQN